MADVRAVYVEWIDSATKPGWHDKDLSGPVVIHSVGIEVERNKEFIVLSTSYSQTGFYTSQISIPNSCIKKIKRVKW